MADKINIFDSEVRFRTDKRNLFDKEVRLTPITETYLIKR